MQIVQGRPRLLVALGEGVFADAVARVLEATEVDDVVRQEVGARLAGAYAAAIVNGALPAGVDAELVIELPDDGPSRAYVRGPGGEEVIDLGSLEVVIDLLDERVGSEVSRRQQLARATTTP
jgi:hypothetical protein